MSMMLTEVSGAGGAERAGATSVPELNTVKVDSSQASSTEEENALPSGRTRARRATSIFTRWTVAHKRYTNKNKASEHPAPEEDMFVKVIAGAPSPSGNDYPPNTFRTSKYTAATFLPINLFEQFRRVANFYFLVIFILQLIPGVSPYPIVITVLPLTFILGVTAVKEGWEDRGRHKYDNSINARSVCRIVPDNPSEEQLVRSDALRVGDIVKIMENDTAPADVLLLSVLQSESDKDNTVWVDTAGLDGETRLKLRRAVFSSDFQETLASGSFACDIVCEGPSPWLERFKGKLSYMGKERGIERENLFVRGAILRNTASVYALVLYTGKRTKLHLNQQTVRAKFSRTEKRLNRYLAAIFFFQTVVCAVLSFVTQAWDRDLSSQLPPPDYRSDVVGWLYAFASWFILFSYMVPMSLYVVLEFSRFASGLYIQWDASFRAENSDLSPMAISSSGVEELGEIDVVLTDKTGTLTRNSMNLTTIATSRGYVWTLEGDEAARPPADVGNESAHQVAAQTKLPGEDDVVDFEECLRIMALCGDLLVHYHGDRNLHPDPFDAPWNDFDPSLLGFSGESPDEAALASAARDLGVALVSRTPAKIVIALDRTDAQGKKWSRIEFEEYLIAGMLPFSPIRKRMAVAVQLTRRMAADGTIVKLDATEPVILLSKGADSTMMPLCEPCSAADALSKVQYNVQRFSCLGLRTLILAKHTLGDEERAAFADAHKAALISMGNRDARIEEAFADIEQRLKIRGTTGVEDRLADGVPGAIKSLVKAGVQVVVLTGDKTETAVNICSTTGLISGKGDEHIHHIVDDASVLGDLQGALAVARERDQRHALVVSGACLRVCLSGAQATEAFAELLPFCFTIICTRMTPQQKARVVAFYKSRFRKVTLAVGDGANDVSMIREAEVGVGILGKEGSQAANAADFALHRFSDLTRLLFVHGRYAHVRVVDAARASTFANMAFNLPLLYFGFVNGFSAQSMYSSMVLTVFNILFTGIVYLAIVFFDRQLDADVAMKVPRLYSDVRSTISWTAFALEMLLAVWFGAIAFVAFSALNVDVLSSDGKPLGLWGLGAVANMVTVPSLLVSYSLRMKCFTWFHAAALGIGSLAFVIILFGTPYMFTYTDELWGFAQYAFVSPSVWLWTLCLVVATILPQYATRAFWFCFNPPLWLEVREKVRVSEQRKVAPEDP